MSKYVFRPELVHPTAWIAPGAVVVGEVILAEQSSIWFNAVLRGDLEPITVGARSNVQDGCLFHTSPGFPLTLGEGVTVGHGAIVHGATVGPNTLIGMGAILLDGVAVGENCLIAAGALLTGGQTFPPGSLILGQPARVVRALTEEEIARNRQTAARYVERARQYREAGDGRRET